MEGQNAPKALSWLCSWATAWLIFCLESLSILSMSPRPNSSEWAKRCIGASEKGPETTSTRRLQKLNLPGSWKLRTAEKIGTSNISMDNWNVCKVPVTSSSHWNNISNDLTQTNLKVPAANAQPIHWEVARLKSEPGATPHQHQQRGGWRRRTERRSTHRWIVGVKPGIRKENITQLDTQKVYPICVRLGCPPNAWKWMNPPTMVWVASPARLGSHFKQPCCLVNKNPKLRSTMIRAAIL